MPQVDPFVSLKKVAYGFTYAVLGTIIANLDKLVQGSVPMDWPTAAAIGCVVGAANYAKHALKQDSEG
jgi:hypothetical protein